MKYPVISAAKNNKITPESIGNPGGGGGVGGGGVAATD